MERAAVSLRLLGVMVSVFCGVLGEARAQEREKVATFVVTDAFESPRQVDEVVAQLQAQLVNEGKRPVHPFLERPAASSDPGLNGARGVGRAAFSELAEGKAPEEVLGAYGSQIADSLSQVSAVRDTEGRALLWNLCALKVHLLMLTAAPGDEAPIREAVLDCSRRFVDRPSVGKAWLQEVMRTFQRFASEVRQVRVAVKSAPAGCELRVYGATVGVTPTVIELIPGEYELQVDCEGREGAVHRVDLREPRDLVFRLDADDALSLRDGASWLRYRNGGASAQVLDDVAALALEAGANSFVILRPGGGANLDVQWMRPPAMLLGGSMVASTATPDGRAQSIASVFRPSSIAHADAAPVAPARRRRIWKDYVLAGGLAAAGAGLSVYPLLAIARDGRCVDANCNAVYEGSGWKPALSLAAAGALVASGVVVLWIAPFGKRYKAGVSAQGVTVRGAF